MTHRFFAWMALVAALGAGPAQAAGEGVGQPAPKARPAKVQLPRHRAAPARAPAASTEQYRATLFHGDAAQQTMERNDQERANWHPVDHSKDDFFSDWRGLK